MSSAMVMAVVVAVVGSDVVGSDGDVAGVAVVVVTGDYGQ